MRILFHSLLALFVMIVMATDSPAGYWENQLSLPIKDMVVPKETIPPLWNTGGPHILTVLPMLTDLGRQQALQMEEVSRELGYSSTVGIYSFDKVGKNWPRDYVYDFWKNQSFALPIFSIDDTGLRGLFRGYDTSKMRPFPHTFLIDSDVGIHRIFRGVQSKEAILEAVQAARDPWTGISLGIPRGESMIKGGNFEDWKNEEFPDGWGILAQGKKTSLKAPQSGWRKSGALEIRSTPEKAYQILFNLIPHKGLLGKKVELQGLARSNCLGHPQIVLAVPHPRLDPELDFIPASPIKTKSGKGIPFRIISSLDYEEGHSAWQKKSVRVTVPEDARALAVFVYLANPKVTGGAAQFDEVSLRVVE